MCCLGPTGLNHMPQRTLTNISRDTIVSYTSHIALVMLMSAFYEQKRTLRQNFVNTVGFSCYMIATTLIISLVQINTWHI